MRVHPPTLMVWIATVVSIILPWLDGLVGPFLIDEQFLPRLSIMGVIAGGIAALVAGTTLNRVGVTILNRLIILFGVMLLLNLIASLVIIPYMLKTSIGEVTIERYDSLWQLAYICFWIEFGALLLAVKYG